VAVFAAVMGGFVLTSFIAQRASGQIESLAETIAAVGAPSIERLASLRTLVLQVELTLSEYLRDGAAGTAARRAELDASMKNLNADVDSYLRLEVLSGEQPYWHDTQTALVRFDDVMDRTDDLINEGRIAEARTEFTRGVQPAGDRLIDAAINGIEFHAQQSRSFASEIRSARRHAIWVANVLSGVCVALGIAGLLLILRQGRRYRALAQAHSGFHQARADELEQFAGRVAHDIRNPLSSAQMGAEVVLRRIGDQGHKELLAGILRSLARADAITTGLLEFARSGARPDPGARTDPGEVLRDLVRGVAHEAEHHRIAIHLEPVPPVLLACAPGVYLSLVSNLVRNAIKYMGDARAREIVLRVIAEGSAVRTEVADTGPGIATVDLPSLFEPYFRAGHEGEGLGLGLATVKKLAEGHGGSVGVASERGRGSTFWFMLPRAGSIPASTEPAQAAPPVERPGRQVHR
jgi:signal transduction histidine kinase